MTYKEQIERLIKISQDRPLLPENYIPWHHPLDDKELYLPEHISTLCGLPEYDELSTTQKICLSKMEVTQVMYSYSFTENLLCMFLNNYLIDLTGSIPLVGVAEYRRQNEIKKINSVLEPEMGKSDELVVRRH